MKNKNKSASNDIMYWKIPLKELYIKGKITEQEFKKMRSTNFEINDDMSNRELEIIDTILAMLTDKETFKELVKKETDFILNGILPNTFPLEWGLYIYEAFEDNLINQEDYIYYLTAINFNDSPSADDLIVINSLIDILRVNLVKNNPEIISYIENPSFNVLMAANKMQ